MRFEGSTKKPRFINPPNLLKQRVGSGGIAKERIAKAEQVIEETQLDFLPYAQEYLKELGDAIKGMDSFASDNDKSFDDLVLELTKPTMKLKANGGMFGYALVSDVADILLEFLETFKDVNKDVQMIMKAHENALHVIIKNKLKGDGGTEGDKLVRELEEACKRYFSRHEDEEKP